MCSYRVGGPAELLAEPVDDADLASLLAVCEGRGLPQLVMGGGSNLLVADEGFAGVVIRLRSPAFQEIEVLDGGRRVRIGAGVRVSRLMGRAGRAGWAGLAFLEGIPGTLGGCVAMNAGTRDGEIREIVERVEVVAPGEATTRRLSGEQCGFGYRSSALPAGAVVTQAWVDPGQGDPAEVKRALKAHHDYRKATQPPGTSGGSVFANPPGDHAGRLIEAAGLKGAKAGGATISEHHANWIVTTPGATAAHVWQLMQRAQAEVQAQFGVTLRLENRVVGFES